MNLSCSCTCICINVSSVVFVTSESLKKMDCFFSLRVCVIVFCNVSFSVRLWWQRNRLFGIWPYVRKRLPIKNLHHHKSQSSHSKSHDLAPRSHAGHMIHPSQVSVTSLQVNDNSNLPYVAVHLLSLPPQPKEILADGLKKGRRPPVSVTDVCECL